MFGRETQWENLELLIGICADRARAREREREEEKDVLSSIDASVTRVLMRVVNDVQLGRLETCFEFLFNFVLREVMPGVISAGNGAGDGV